MANKTLLFTPVKVGRAGEEIALQIEAAILDGRLKPGDGLPSERDLQSQFGTGRGVVREALKALRQKGLIEVRKGAKGGAFVRQPDVANVSESLALFLKQSDVSPERIIEFRETIDRSVASLAVARATAEDRDALLAGALRLKERIDGGDDDMAALAEADRELNVRLARMSGNPVFEWVMHAMQMGFGSRDFALYEDADYRKWTAANWVDTAQAIKDGDPLRALSFIGNHYVLLRRRFAEGEAAAAGGFLSK